MTFLSLRARSSQERFDISSSRSSSIHNPQNPYTASLSNSSLNLFEKKKPQKRQNSVNQFNKSTKLPPLKDSGDSDEFQLQGSVQTIKIQEKPQSQMQQAPPHIPTAISFNKKQGKSEQEQVQIGYVKLQQQMEQTKKFVGVTEKFIVECYTKPVYEAVESILVPHFKAATVTFWQDIPSLHLLYSPRLQATVSHSSGLVGYTFFTRKILKIEKAVQHSAYLDEVDSKICPGTTPVYIFPIWDYHDDVVGVIEITRQPKDPFFNQETDDFVEFFTHQFKLFSKWLFHTNVDHELIRELSHVMEMEQFLLLFQKRIHTYFNCRAAEIWRYNMRTEKMQKFTTEGIDIDPTRAGVVGDAMTKECTLNMQDTKMSSSYMDYLDSEDGESCLVVPVVDMKAAAKWAICLRGSKTYPVFTAEDEEKLKEMAPYLALALENADKYSDALIGETRKSIDYQCINGIQNLAEMVNTGKDLDVIIDDAVTTITQLTNADRAYLFTFDSNINKYITKAAVGCKEKPPPMETNKGVLGHTFNTRQVINLPDAYDEPLFDSMIDDATKYKTKTLLSAPILNNRQNVIGVIQLLNKKDNQPFSHTDLKFIKMYALVFGMMLDNQTMFDISSSASQQLTSFLNVSTALSSNASVKSILGEIMTNARATTMAERASLFLLDDVIQVLTAYLADGGSMPQTIPLSHGIAASALKSKQPIIVSDPYHDPRFNKLIDFHTGFKTKSLLAVPVLTPEGKAIGVAELVNKQEGVFTQDDLKLLESFATFAAMLLEKRRLKDITEKGSAQIEMAKWVGEFERRSYKCPIKLSLPPDKQEVLRSLDFFAIDWNGIGLFQIAFFVFNDFGLLQQFKITNELFFTFLYKLRESYNEPPYHNWIHAIDVLQYISYQVRLTNCHNILNKFELLAVCVAALCHDAGHQGFNNAFNVNAETPLGILFKDQSVMETFHCTVAIRILSQPESNLFHTLNDKELQVIWKWIIHLILATDMAFHFKLIKQGNDALEAGVINLKEESYRLMVMELIMKVSDISNVSRPFKYADKWCEVLSEEFWRQGDREKALGLEYSGPLMNRAENNKPKGQVGFYNFVCLPLYSLIARIFPELTVNLNSVKSNLEHWVKLVQEQETQKKEEDEKEAKEKEEKEKQEKEVQEKQTNENNEAPANNGNEDKENNEDDNNEKEENKEKAQEDTK